MPFASLLLRALPLLPDSAARRLFRHTHPFDLRHHTHTGGLLYPPDLPTGHAHDAANEGYYATAPSVFRQLISRWQTTLDATPRQQPRPAPESSPQHLHLSHYHFFDLGCGKGRVLLLASQLPFRSVTGLELHPGLCAAARRNVDLWLRRPRPCPRISVLHADVLQLDLPSEPVVLFLFNSFGEEVLQPLLHQLAAHSRQRTAPIDLLYVHPDCAATVESTPGIQTLFRGDIPFTREDALADAFGVNFDHCAIYRLAPQAPIA